MNLLRCHIFGFGKLASLSADLRPGLNLVFAPNEGGKSTLQRFLISLLYGQLRSDLKNQRRLESWVDRYRPWHAPGYGGVLWCRLASGRDLEICRTFGKDESRIEIRTSTGENIVDQYEQQRNGDVVFARAHLGLPKDLYESVAVIRENRVAELNGHESIRDRISNLAQSGDEELSVRQSLESLQNALESVGSDRAPTRPYKQTLDLLQTLQEEKRALERRRAEFQDWVDERNRLSGEVGRMESDLLTAKRVVALSRWAEALHKVRVLEDIDAELTALVRERQEVGGDPSFPANDLEELNRLSGAQESLERRLQEVRDETQEAFSRLRSAGEQRQQLAQYERLSVSPEAEKITEWFVSYLSLSLQKDNAQKSISMIRQEKDAAEKSLVDLGPILNSSEADWERKAREASEQETDYTRKGSVLAEEISRQQVTAARLKSRYARRRLVGFITALCALLPWGVLFLPELIPGVAMPIRLAVSLPLAGLAMLIFYGAAKARDSGSQVTQKLQALETEQQRLRQEGSKAREEIRKAIADSGLKTMGEFLSAAKRSEQLRQDIARLSARITEEERNRQRTQSEASEVYERLKESLASVGLGCAPGNIKAQIDILRVSLRKFREADSHYRNCSQAVENLRADEQHLAEESAKHNSHILAILTRAGVDTIEAYRECCRKRQRTIELMEKETSRSREFQRLCAGRSLEEWKHYETELRREQLEEGGDLTTEELATAVMAVESGVREPTLPYLPSSTEAISEESRISAQLSSAREEHARFIERVNQAFHQYRGVSEIEEDIQLAEQSMHNLSTNREALGIALETINALSREQQEVLAPQLNRAVEQRLVRLCSGRYEEVKIDPDFEIWVREKSTGELRVAEHLSRGMQDQLYFALRFGILDLVSSEAEPCPSLLDEPFAAYDGERMVEAFKVLEDEALRRQLLLFTCREDLLKLAKGQGAHVLELPAT